MKLLSIDIETAGLGRDCSLLEVGAVIDDLANPRLLEELPKFHTYVLNDKIIGEPYALAMHKTILDRIAKLEEPYKYTQYSNLKIEFCGFIRQNYEPIKEDFYSSHYEINVAGKNYAMFDRDWLDSAIFNNDKPPTNYKIKICHRVIDPSILFLKLGQDKTLPSSKECLKRAGLNGEVAHTALDDAIMVCRLLRRHYYH